MEIASDPLASRLCGWLPIDLKGAPLFAGAEDPSRMNVIRPKIEEVRKRWYRLEDYDALKDNLRRIIKQDRHPQELLEKTQSLLVDFRGWRDYNSANADAPPLSFEQDYTAIELYCSDIGYKFMFGLINQVLRKKDLDDSQMLGAVTLVEFLTIDLYNYRLANIGNPLYHDFQGIVHRGMSVTPEELSSFQAAATGPPFQRNFSVPLAFASCSTDEGKIQEFLKSNPEKDRCQLHWVIHVHSANPRLMARYQHKYPDSIVTSLCAMPIATVSEFAEKEILLRGAFFHIVRMTTEQVGDNTVHKLEMVMLNTNRDHGSELAENKNDKEEQRRYLTKIIQATKFEICASLAQEYGLSGDAQIYQEEVKRIVDDLDTHDIGALDPSNSSLTDSPSAPALTWLGASLKSAFPEHYVKRRDMLSSAAYKGEWEKVMKIIHDDYDFQMCDWCNIPRLYAERNARKSGYTVLHQAAFHGAPAEIVKELVDLGAWCTLRTTDKDRTTAVEIAHKTLNSIIASQATTVEIAQQRRNAEILVTILKPNIRHEVSQGILEALETHLHGFIERLSMPFIEKFDIRLPQISVMTEMQDPKLWIPVPGMCGGFFVELVHQSELKVRKYAGNYPKTYTVHRITIDGVQDF